MNQADLGIIKSTLDLLDFAEYLPRELIMQPNDNGHWPSTTGEYIVNYTIHPLLTHEWSSDVAEEVIDEVLDCLSVLDTGVDRPKTWDALFIAKKKCRENLPKI